MKKYREQPFYFVNDIWVNMPAAFVLPKYSPVTSDMSKFILRMFDCGVISKVFGDYTTKGGELKDFFT